MNCACKTETHDASCPSRILGEKLGLEPIRREASAAVAPVGAELTDDVYEGGG